MCVIAGTDANSVMTIEALLNDFKQNYISERPKRKLGEEETLFSLSGDDEYVNID